MRALKTTCLRGRRVTKNRCTEMHGNARFQKIVSTRNRTAFFHPFQSDRGCVDARVARDVVAGGERILAGSSPLSMMSTPLSQEFLMRLMVVLMLLAASCVARAEAPAPETPPIATVATLSPAATSSPTSLFDPARHMRVSEIKPGMKGFGLSVFYGTKIEKCD
jgi:hypothetical protein